MSNRRKVKKPGWSRARLMLALGGLALAVILAVFLVGGSRRHDGPLGSGVSATPAAAPGANAATGGSSELLTMETAQAVMVTVELDFGPRIPTIAEALKEIDRKYQPDDGRGRTFAILDAYGEPTPDGKLHM